MTVNEFEANNIVIALTFLEKVLTNDKPWDYLESQELLEPDMGHLSKACLHQRDNMVRDIQPIKAKFEELLQEADKIIKGENGKA